MKKKEDSEMERLMGDGSLVMHHLGSSVAMHVIRSTALPFKPKRFPLLSDMCLKSLAKNFGRYPGLKGVNEADREYVYKHLSTDKENFPVVLMANHVNYEKFWKDVCKQHYKIIYLDEKKDKCFKNVFFSNYLQDYLQKFVNYDENYDELAELINAAKDYITKLSILEIMTVMDLYEVLSPLRKLQHLNLTLGRKRVGMDFEKNMTGMQLSDIENLANALHELKELKVLNLNGNELEDYHVKVIVEALENHPSLVELNLSHNKISNDGARRLSRLFMVNPTIKILKLNNNQIGYEGARCFSIVLSENKSLEELHLKLNFISDKAGIKFFEDLSHNSTLRVLDLSANLLTDESVPAILDCVNSGENEIKELILSCTNFTDAVLQDLKIGLMKNKTLDVFDISKSQMNRLNEKQIIEIITKYNLDRRNITFISDNQLEKYREEHREKTEELEEDDKKK